MKTVVKKNSINKKWAIAAVLGCAATVPALAHDAGDFFVRVGAASVQPDASSGSVLGGGVDVEDDVGLGFSGTYFFSKHLGLEVLAALPFSHDIVGTGALNGLDIGSTKHLPPTISLQYYPLNHATVQPYIGVGLNYTTFFEEDTSSELDAALSGRTSMALDDSTGIAFQLGVDWQMSPQWALNLAVWKVDIDTTADIKLNGAHAASVDVSIDPIVVMAGVAFKW